MTPKLTSEQRAALRSHLPGHPVPIEDEESKQIYWLVSPDDVPSLWADYLPTEVEVGLAAIERGEVVQWNSEAMKERARAAATRAAEGR